ncbi:MAG TPA: hypothetical protein VGR64_02815 [Terracidiphilus sp.]|nr:hypothetical protein [Terracidiphilus sp.]
MGLLLDESARGLVCMRRGMRGVHKAAGRAADPKAGRFHSARQAGEHGQARIFGGVDC